MLPLCVRREPGKFVVVRKQPPVTHATKSSTRHVVAASNRVVLTKLLLDEGVAKQTQDGDALLHSRVREPPPTLDGKNIGSLWIGAVSQVLNVKSHQITCNGFRLDVLLSTEAQVIIETPSIGVHCFWGKLQVSLPLKPISRQGVLCHQRVLFPADLGHGVPPCERTTAPISTRWYHAGIQAKVTTLILVP